MDFSWSLLKHAVLQRNKQDVSDHPFFGSAKADGRLMLRATDASGVVAGFEGCQVGKAKGGKLSGRITGLPVGGPYDLQFTLVDEKGKKLDQCKVTDVLVGDLWILAGQSNMQGAGYLPGLVKENPMLRNFYMDNRWDITEDPLHNTAQAAAPAHGGNPDYKPPKKDLRGVGPGMSFAEAMWQATGVPQGTIACAHGGTFMYQWDPALLKDGNRSLYGAMVERYRTLGGKVAGMIWHQGCNEADSVNAPLYEERFRTFLKAVRKDFGMKHLPIVISQIGPYLKRSADPEIWAQVQYVQAKVGASTPDTLCISTIDLPLDDAVHMSSASQYVIGRRMAEAMRYLKGDKTAKPPIEAVSARVMRDPASGNANIRVKFRNVVGKLIANGEPFGFYTPEVGMLTGEACFKVELRGSEAIVHTSISARAAEKYVLVYGLGTMPFATLRDEGGRGVPGFVLPLKGLNENSTDMVGVCQVSDPVYGPEQYTDLHMPADPDALCWQPAKFSQGFYLEHPRRVELSTPEEKVFYFRFRMDVPEDMDLDFLYGTDGPFAIFCDGREINRGFAINPVLVDEYSSAISLSKGTHEWYIAFSSNTGHSYGICCRFLRPGKGVLPTIIPW